MGVLQRNWSSTALNLKRDLPGNEPDQPETAPVSHILSKPDFVPGVETVGERDLAVGDELRPSLKVDCSTRARRCVRDRLCWVLALLAAAFRTVRDGFLACHCEPPEKSG